MAIPAGDLVKLNSSPQTSKLYMIVQQAQHRVAGAWAGYRWSGTVSVAVAPTDPCISISVNSNNAVQLLDGMTVLIGSTEYGGWDVAIARVHGDQNIGAGAETLYVAISSELRGVFMNHFVVVLDEFRLWQRYPKVVDAGGITFYKDYGYFRDVLGANGYQWTDLADADSSMPACPIMSSHAVRLIDAGGSDTVTFNWTPSYANAVGGVVNSWTSSGLNGGAGWNSVIQVPGAQTYTNISGQAGYRVTLAVATNLSDPLVEFRRGVRYVFTLRRPGNGASQFEEPFVNFSVSNVSGDFDSGSWRFDVTMFEASGYDVIPGALVILFTEDTYGGVAGSIGPLSDRENILCIGHIADGTITHNVETGETTFSVESMAEQAGRRENYPVPIEDALVPADWYQAESLTTNRAAWHYIAWHTNFPLVTDVYLPVTNYPIRGQEFSTGDISKSTVDNFLQARIFGRVLFDRYERMICQRDADIEAYNAAPMLFNLNNNAYWIDEVRIQERNEPGTSQVNAGGVLWDGTTFAATPYLAISPGEMAGYKGRPTSATTLAIDTQATLNTLAGRYYAAQNRQYPSLTLSMAGHWRYGDITPQEIVYVNLVTDRVTFVNEPFLIRRVTHTYDAQAGAMFTEYELAQETDSIDAATIAIEATMPIVTGITITVPPQQPNTPTDGGRRIITTIDGCFVTDNILRTGGPIWYAVNTGLTAGANRRGWKIMRDPWNWWTAGATKKLWGIFGSEGDGTGKFVGGILYKHNNFPNGTWVKVLDPHDHIVATYAAVTDVIGSIEVEDFIACVVYTNNPNGWAFFYSLDAGANWTHTHYGEEVVTQTDGSWPRVPLHIAVANHSAAQTFYVGHTGFIYEMLLHKTVNRGGAWNTVFNGSYGYFGRILVPYHSATWTDDYVVFERIDNENCIIQSQNGGVNWSTIRTVPAGKRVTYMSDYTFNHDYYAYLGFRNHGIYYTHNNGVGWTQFNASYLPYSVSYAGMIDWTSAGDVASVLLEDWWLLGTTIPIIRYVTPGSFVDVTGNLWTVAPTQGYVTTFERDTVGSA